MRILLEGVSLFSDNRGVNALGLGAVNVLVEKYNISEIEILAKGKERRVLTEEIKVSGDRRVIVNVNYFVKKDFIRALAESTLRKIVNYPPKSNLSKLFYGVDLVFNVNEGDSFSDIYGIKRIIYHAIDSWLALGWNKPIIFLPQTIGPFHSIVGRYIAKSILKKVRQVYVRDDKANRFLDKINVAFKINIDMAVFMEVTPIMNYELPKNFVGFNINGLMYFNRYKSMKDKYLRYRELVHKIINFFLSKNINILLIPHTYNVDNPNEEDDLEAIKEIYSNSSNEDKMYLNIVSKDYNAQEIKYIISKSDFFIGSRMHSCIAALSSNVPSIGLAYSYKFEGTFSMFNMEETVINTADIQIEDIEQILDKIKINYSNRDQLKEKLIKNTFSFNW